MCALNNHSNHPTTPLKNIVFIFGMFSVGLGKVFGRLLEDVWATFCDIFGIFFEISRDVLGKVSGRSLEVIATTPPRGLVYGVHISILVIFGPKIIIIMGFLD